MENHVITPVPMKQTLQNMIWLKITDGLWV